MTTYITVSPVAQEIYDEARRQAFREAMKPYDLDENFIDEFEKAADAMIVAIGSTEARGRR